MARLSIKTRITIPNKGQIFRQLRAFGEKAEAALERAEFEEAMDIVRDSQREVPVDTGTLKNSWGVMSNKIKTFGAKGSSFSEPIRPGEIVLGYGGAASEYALTVHENPRAGKTGGVSPSGRTYKTYSAEPGRKWKFLEDPFKAAKRGMSLRIGNRMKKLLRS